MSNFPNPPTILSTKNYDVFNFIDWNRTICKNNLLKLVNENKLNFQMHKFPILVTRDFKIIDGQHRFEASKKLGCPVYYIIDGDDFSFSKVHSVNKAGKKHSLKDKIEMLYKSGDKGAETVYNLSTMFPSFDISTIATLLISYSRGGGQINQSIDRNGTIVIGHLSETVVLLEEITKSKIPNKFANRIAFSVSHVCKESNINPSVLLDRVSRNIIKWIEPRSIEETIRVIKSCYNYGLSEKKRI
jgi:hypothetical protein